MPPEPSCRETSICALEKKANATRALLQRNIYISPRKTKEMCYTTLVRPITEYGSIIGCVALFRLRITPTAHYSDNPLLRRPIFPTMQNRTQSTNPWFNQVYPTGCSVGQANLDGPWPRQNVLERKRSFYPRLYIPVQGNYDRPTWYGES